MHGPPSDEKKAAEIFVVQFEEPDYLAVVFRGLQSCTEQGRSFFGLSLHDQTKFELVTPASQYKPARESARIAMPEHAKVEQHAQGFQTQLKAAQATQTGGKGSRKLSTSGKLLQNSPEALSITQPSTLEGRIMSLHETGPRCGSPPIRGI